MAQARRSSRTAKPRPKSPARVKQRSVAAANAPAASIDAELVGLATARVRRLPRLRALVRAERRPGARCTRRSRASAGPPTSHRSCSCPLGALIVSRSALVDVRPFRLGLSRHAGRARCSRSAAPRRLRRPGSSSDARRRRASARPGRQSSASSLTLVGVLLLTGASLGAILRRSGHAVRSASTRVRRERPTPRRCARRPESPRTSSFRAARPPSRPSTCPRLPGRRRGRSAGVSRPRRFACSTSDRPRTPRQSLFDAARRRRPSTALPDRALLKRSKPGGRPERRGQPAHRRGARPAASRTSASTRR